MTEEQTDPRLLSPEEMKAINDAMPGEAKYGDVFEAIAEAQAKISFQAGQDSIVDKENLNFKRGFQSALQMVQEKLKEWGLKEGK